MIHVNGLAKMRRESRCDILSGTRIVFIDHSCKAVWQCNQRLVAMRLFNTAMFVRY